MTGLSPTAPAARPGGATPSTSPASPPAQRTGRPSTTRAAPADAAPPGGHGPHRDPDADEDPWAKVGRFFRTEEPVIAIPRDIGISVVAIMLVIGGLWAYTGQPFPDSSPMVVVESGSMMHPGAPYGRVGTIDPGDLILVKDVDGPHEITTAFEPGDRTGYGGLGDVIVFFPYGDTQRTPIIHRAMTWVDIVPTSDLPAAERPDQPYVYDYVDERGVHLRHQETVDLPSLGLNNFRPIASGFVTRGDNPDTNRNADQVSLVDDELIQAEWVIGKARGEIPWVGLLKLGLTGNDRPRDTTGHCNVLNGWGPCDAWNMLGLGAVAIVAPPLLLDLTTRIRDRRVLGSGGGKR